MAVTITSTSERITISGNYKAFTGGTGNTTTVINYASGDAPVSSDVNGRRFLMWKNGTNTGNWEIRFILSATTSTVTVTDGGFSSAPPNNANFVISTTLAEIENSLPNSVMRRESSSYQMRNRDFELADGAFVADVNCSLVTKSTQTGSGFITTYPIADGCALQFGRLIGGEANNSTETIGGCQITFEVANDTLIFSNQNATNSNGAILNFYGCLIESYDNGFSPFIRASGAMRLIGCISDGALGGRLYNSASELVSTRFSGNKSGVVAWSLGGVFTRPIDDAFFFQGNTAVKAFRAFNGVFTNVTFADSLTNIIDAASAQSGLLFTFIDCTTFPDSKISVNQGNYKQAKSINYTITDSSGTGLTGAKVAVYDNTGTIQGSIKTSSSNGLVDAINAVFFDKANGAAALTKSPFDIRIRLDGYVYLGFQSAVSEPIKQELRLSLNSQRVDVGANAAAITGISLDFATRTLTLTEDRNTQKLYDYYQYQLFQDAQMQYGEDLIRTGNSFDLNDWDMVVDGCTYTGDATTTATISLINAGVFNGTRTDQNGTVFPPIDVTFTDLQAGSQLVVYVTGTTTEKFRTNNSSTSEQWTEVYTTDINYDVTIQKTGFFPIRLTNLTASTIPITTSINQLIDRAYQTSSGLLGGAYVDITAKEFSVSVNTTVQNYYSFWIEQWISNLALRNIKFPISTFGGNSFSFDDGYEFTNSSLQYLSRDGFRYFDNGTVTARYAAILSQGVSTGLQAEYQQAQGGSISDAQNTGNVDQVIQIYGDSTHGNFDYTDYLVFKVQGNGFRQAEANIVSVFGTLEEQFYVTSLNTLAIPNFTIGNPNVTGLIITDDSANPVSWDAGDGTARDYSLTITDTNNNTGENILRWLNYNLSLDATFEGKDPFYYPEMVIDNGSSYETIRGVLYGSTSNVLAGVRVIDGNGDPHKDFTKFQSDDGSYGVPVEIKTASISGITTNSRLRIYNQTTSQETFNGVITGTSYTEEYTEGNNYSQGNLLSIRIAQQSGATAKLPYETQVIVGATGWSLLVSQEDDVIYNQIAIDGSAVTKFEADYQNNEIDIIVASDFTGIELYSRYVYFTTTEDGIRDFFKAFNPLDIANYENDVTVLDLYLNNNTSTNIKQIDNVRLFKSDNSYPVREPTTGGGGIDVNWRNTVYPVGLGDLENKVQNLVNAENADIFVTPTRFTKKIAGTETVILEKTYTTDGQGTESLTQVT